MQKEKGMKAVGNYKFFIILTIFAVSVTCFVNLFFYFSIQDIIVDTSAKKLHEILFEFCFIMALTTVVFIFFVTFMLRKFISPEIDENRKLKLRFESMSESIGDGVMTLNSDGIIIFVNSAAARLLGYTKDEMVGANAHELVHYETREGRFVSKHECYVLKQLSENGSCSSEDDSYVRKDKVKIDISFIATPLIVSGRNEGSIIVFSDITEKKRNIKKLLLTDTIVKNIREGVLVTDKDANIIFVNNYFESLTGYSASSVIGKKPNILKSDMQDDRFYQDMWLRLKMNNCWQGEIWNKKKNGKAYAEWLSITAVENTQEMGQKYYVAIFSDITERKLLEAELSKERELLKYQATYDVLTKLYNRQKFEEILEVEFDRRARYGTVFSAIMFDIDNFKHINDNFGHLAGDMVLQELGKLIQKCVRKTDMACRWGGEEFLIVTPQTDLQGAMSLAENLRESIAENIFPTIGRITCSFGVSSYAQDDDRDLLIKRVDDALYISKKEGKNKITLL
jgi:diguanylate cyclase (GGDEF)-like protein/PAS domain S-box-containing protein